MKRSSLIAWVSTSPKNHSLYEIHRKDLKNLWRCYRDQSDEVTNQGMPKATKATELDSSLEPLMGAYCCQHLNSELNSLGGENIILLP